MEIEVYKNTELGSIRTMMINDEPWFVGKDVAEILGYSNTAKTISTHVDDEDKQIFQTSQNGNSEINNRGIYIINESGLYSLILSSKLPKAKKFKRWVTSEVLPSIRNHGMYGVDIDKLTSKIASEVIKQLSASNISQSALNRTEDINSKKHAYAPPKKIDMLPPSIKAETIKMMKSPYYPCRVISQYIFSAAGQYVSIVTVNNYRRMLEESDENAEQLELF